MSGDLPEPAPRRLGLFRSFHKLLVIFFDDRLLLGVWNWSDVKFLSLLNDCLVAITIPIPFDDRGIFGFYDGCHRRRDQRCCYASEDKLAHRSVSKELRLIENLEIVTVVPFFRPLARSYFCAGRREPNARATGTLITAARFSFAFDA